MPARTLKVVRGDNVLLETSLNELEGATVDEVEREVLSDGEVVGSQVDLVVTLADPEPEPEPEKKPAKGRKA